MMCHVRVLCVVYATLLVTFATTSITESKCDDNGLEAVNDHRVHVVHATHATAPPKATHLPCNGQQEKVSFLTTFATEDVCDRENGTVGASERAL